MRGGCAAFKIPALSAAEPPSPHETLMKAAIVHSFDQAPRYGDIAAPQPQAGEVLVSTRAASLTQLVRAQAAGKHYSSGKTLPFVPGADGVGMLDGGRRVYFAFPRAPIGAMAEQVAVKASQCVTVPDDIDDLTAAAIANPGMSSWAALALRARFQRGESVLINGAAGTSGRLAIQIARHLGASRIVVTARNPAVEDQLKQLGADRFIGLDQPAVDLVDSFRQEMQSPGIDVVLDYLWGPPAEALLEAASGHGSGAASPRLRLVNIGSLAGPWMALNAGALRSSGVELLGSGLGSISNDDLVQVVGELLQAIGSAQLKIDAEAVPLREVEQAWSQPSTRRIVFTI